MNKLKIQDSIKLHYIKGVSVYLINEITIFYSDKNLYAITELMALRDNENFKNEYDIKNWKETFRANPYLELKELISFMQQNLISFVALLKNEEVDNEKN